MNTAATLTIACVSEEVRERLAAVLAPDNEGLPRGLHLSMVVRGRSIEFSLDADSPYTSISTALALLRDIVLFEEVWLLSRTRPG